MKELLEKTRKLSRLILNLADYPVSLDEIAGILRDAIGADVFIVGRRGEVLGAGTSIQVNQTPSERKGDDTGLSADFNDDLLAIRDTTADLHLKGVCRLAIDVEFVFEGKLTTVLPIYGGGERLGTLLVSRQEMGISDADTLLAEYIVTVAGLEILGAERHLIEDEARKKATVEVTLGALSYSELKAVEHIFNELDGNEGLFIASKIADREGITRSVIVNAFRKLEGAGVLESRSLGMKGTYIRILNDRLVEEFRRLRAK